MILVIFKWPGASCCLDNSALVYLSDNGNVASADHTAFHVWHATCICHMCQLNVCLTQLAICVCFSTCIICLLHDMFLCLSMLHASEVLHVSPVCGLSSTCVCYLCLQGCVPHIFMLHVTIAFVSALWSHCMWHGFVTCVPHTTCHMCPCVT